jgi:predicted NBD/HSP70 family sugar kinase
MNRKKALVETSAARLANRSAVLARLLTAPANVTRGWLAESTGLSQATVSRVTDGLITEGMVAEGAEVASGHRGRNAVSLRLTDTIGVVCGVDIGGRNCAMIVSDLRGKQLARSDDATPVHLGPAELARWLADRVATLTGEQTGPLRAVAIGLPGMVTDDGLRISGAPNVPQIEGTDFAARLREAIGARVTLDNDANLALLGELRFGGGHGLSAVVTLTIGTGLGAGVALDGRLIKGRGGMVGEFGYLPIGPSGELAEELLSGTGLLRRARALGVRLPEPSDVFAPDAPTILAPLREQFDQALLMVLAAASTAYEPEAIVIGGVLLPVIAQRLPAIAVRLRELLPAAPRLRLSLLGNRAGVLGAVVAACQAGYAPLGISAEHAAGLPFPSEVLTSAFDDASLLGAAALAITSGGN